ncbi:MAG: type I-MYXAN CRISPR-associated protein Cmx8 [bacterium]|jgi:CRISPR-associated protein Cmx8
MPRKSVNQPEESLILNYDLASLPSAQHKAGLAGLLLMIETLKNRRLSPLPDILELSEYNVDIQLTLESLQVLFDDLYDAEWVETASKTKWKNKQPLRVDEKEKRFIYKTYQPKGMFLDSLYRSTQNDLWIKLWRDMLWNTLRGQPLTRNVYEERAEGRPSSVALKVWQNIHKSIQSKKKNKIFTDSIAGSLFVGAQDSNAEQVPFQGLPEHNFLLHFWILPTLLFAPRQMNIEGRLNDIGYVLAIPEPLNLVEFLEDIKDTLCQLDSETDGYNPGIMRYVIRRPKAAVIDIPEEGGLEFLYYLTKNRIEQENIIFSIASIEIYHLEKQGNNIRTHASAKIKPSSSLLKEYNHFREQYLNPLYKAQRLRNMLNQYPWFWGMSKHLREYPRKFFILSDSTPYHIPFFGWDVFRKFKSVQKKLEQKNGGRTMDATHQDDALALKVRRLIQSYVRQRAEEKSGRKYKDFEKEKDTDRTIYPREYKDALGKVCMDAFLAMRSRRDKDFVEYFTGTICSVPQYLSENDYLDISLALLNETEWEKVKTFSMLALSAESSFARVQDQIDNESKGE